MQNGCVTGSVRNLLIQEFKSWKDQNKVSLSLVSDSVCDDGRVCLKLSLGRDKIFSLFCPAEYPEYEDNFFAESDSVNHLWLNALNEFILDSEGSLTLDAILWKANSLDSRVRYSPSNSSDDEDENEEFMVLEEEDEEDLLERALWDKEKQWRAKEVKLRASMKEAEEWAGPSTSSGVIHKDQKSLQVFSNFAASGILTNDLKHIIKTAGDTGIDVEPIDSNIYEWSVRFSKFDPDSKLQHDLDLLQKSHGIGYIELQLEFTMDLYPFYPPVAKMVRPRPEGSVRFMLACLDILKLSSWNPTCGMITVLEEIKDYLARHAVLHVETAFRPSILLPIENSLLQLALVSEVMPRDSSGQSIKTSKSDPSGATSKHVTPSTSSVASLSAMTTVPSAASILPVSQYQSSGSGSSGKLALAGLASAGTSSHSESSTSKTSSSSMSSTAGPSGVSMSSSASTSSASSASSTGSNALELCKVSNGNEKEKANLPTSVPAPSSSAVYSDDHISLVLSKKSILKNQVMNALRQHNGKKPKFPDGTGYSTLSDKGWDINAHIAVEKEKDKKIEAVLQKILQDLQEYLCHYDSIQQPIDDPMTESSDGSDMNDEAMVCNGQPSQPSSSKTVPESALPQVSISLSAYPDGGHSAFVKYERIDKKEMKIQLPSQAEASRQLYDALDASTLIPFIEQKLQVDSFLEICRHKAVYRCVIDILSEIAGRLWLARLLWKQPGQKKSIYSLLLSIKDKAQKVLDRYKLAAESSHSKNEKKGKKRANSGSRDKDKATRKSKVASTSPASPLGMDSSEDEAGPSGVDTSSSDVKFDTSNAESKQESSQKDYKDYLSSAGQMHSKKGVMTRSAYNLTNKSLPATLSKQANISVKSSSGSGKSSASASKTSASASTSKPHAIAASTSKASASASTSKSNTGHSKPSTSKGLTGSLKASDGPSTSHSHSVNPFSKLKFFGGKLDMKKSASSGGEQSKDDSGPVGLSGFISNLSNINFSWQGWSAINNEQDPPPIDMTTPLDPAGDEQLAQDFFDLALKVEKVIETLGYPGCDSPEHSDEPLEARRVSVITSTSEVLNQELATAYIAALKDMQFDSCDIDVTNTTSHTYATTFNSALPPGRAQMMRIAQELASLSTSLPLDLASAIFVRSDDAKITLLKALIIGPEGTPYASGCFLFDIFLPSNYPKSPPKVTLRTTGRGTVRFNPNLYATGKVCLSLLGTWNGLQGEQWNETSTLLQVLVSIQSLIMVAEPYFNEPGYDSLMGTADGRAASECYNHNVKLQTVRLAMIEMLKYPPADFEDVIKTHFRIKRRRIMEDLDNYLLLHPNQSALSKSYKTLKSELMKLKD